MTTLYPLTWLDEDCLCGIFATPEKAKSHLLEEIKRLAKTKQGEIAEWHREASLTSGNDAKHALTLAQICQNQLDAGLVDLSADPVFESFGGDTIEAYSFCGETFLISTFELDVGRRIFS